jgi:hypothetical protein
MSRLSKTPVDPIKSKLNKGHFKPERDIVKHKIENTFGYIMEVILKQQREKELTTSIGA